jgi:hypothetical protein
MRFSGSVGFATKRGPETKECGLKQNAKKERKGDKKGGEDKEVKKQKGRREDADHFCWRRALARASNSERAERRQTARCSSHWYRRRRKPSGSRDAETTGHRVEC